MPASLINSESVIFRDLAIRSKRIFSSSVHLCVMLAVNFSVIEAPPNMVLVFLHLKDQLS
ncbi:hypothetical protein J503_3240 [Acinetobacter baumannii 984213]|nr:hypothetical protein J503_3240 [Acinetobacter baumannii 984213]